MHISSIFLLVCCLVNFRKRTPCAGVAGKVIILKRNLAIVCSLVCRRALNFPRLLQFKDEHTVLLSSTFLFPLLMLLHALFQSLVADCLLVVNLSRFILFSLAEHRKLSVESSPTFMGTLMEVLSFICACSVQTYSGCRRPNLTCALVLLKFKIPC